MLEQINEWNAALGDVIQTQLAAGSLVAVLVAFASGVLTSFTPCVYPIIPVTVTYIGGASAGNRRRAAAMSVVYVCGLAVVYASLGVASALLGKTFGVFTRTPAIFGAVGLLIILFGIAMLDVFNIPVPSFFTGVQAEGTRRGGYLGALLMGVAAGFVAAPCTAPVMLTLLVHVASSRDVVWGGTLLLVFSLGLGFLLMILGMFSGMLSSLPKPGPWMTWVKRGFGAVMVLTGGWFLLQAVTMLIDRGGTA